MRKNPLTLALAAATLLVSGTGTAATVTITGLVSRVAVDGSTDTTANYGGCMAAITPVPATQTWQTGCTAGWVTFSCTGNFATNQVQAYRLLDQAQLALTTGKKVTVYYSNAAVHNGICFANRVDVIK